MSKDLIRHILNKIELKNGQKLILRKPIIEDAEKMVEYLNIVGAESDNLLFGKDEFRLTAEQEMEHIKNISKDVNIIMILGIINNNIVSIAQISSPSKRRIAHNSEVAISVRKDYWRSGIGSNVMAQLIRLAKERGTIKNISLGVKANNKGAIIMYEKFGFRRVGVHRDYFNVDGVYYDEILMDLYI